MSGATQGIIRQVLQTIKTHQMILCGDKILVGVSGGVDSCALLHILVSISQKILPVQLAIAHLNHGLRPESIEESKYVRSLAQKYGLPIYLEHADLLAEGNTRLEERARQMRYDFFIAAARKFKAAGVAVAHTSDDQVETVLMRILKGGGIRGLSGMPYCRELDGPKTYLIRPCLDIQKDELLEYARQKNLQWYEDQSNQNLVFERNRIRHSLLPLINREFNPGIRSALLRVSKRCREMNVFIEQEASSYYQQCRLPICAEKPDLANFFQLLKAPLVTFDSSSFFKIPRALHTFILQKALKEIQPNPPMVRENHYEMINQLAHSQNGEVKLTEHISVVKANRQVYIYRQQEPSLIGVHELDIPGAIEIKGLVLSCREIDIQQLDRNQLTKKFADLGVIFSLDHLATPLKIRAPRQGETIRPLGAGGTRKIAKILSELRVPRPLRPQVMIVTDYNDQPVWLTGICLAHACRVTSHTHAVAQLQLQSSRDFSPPAEN